MKDVSIYDVRFSQERIERYMTFADLLDVLDGKHYSILTMMATQLWNTKTKTYVAVEEARSILLQASIGDFLRLGKSLMIESMANELFKDLGKEQT